MRKLLYIIVVVGLLTASPDRADIGKMLPVELLSVRTRAGWVEIRTDTGNMGTGKDFEQAYHNLTESASSEIFLDTADYLIFESETWERSEELLEYLRPDIRVCTGDAQMDLKKAAQYLSLHRPEIQLKDLQSGVEIEHLMESDNGFVLVRKRLKKEEIRY